MLPLGSRLCFSCFRVGKEVSKGLVTLGQPMTTIISLWFFRLRKTQPMLMVISDHLTCFGSSGPCPVSDWRSSVVPWGGAHDLAGSNTELLFSSLSFLVKVKVLPPRECVWHILLSTNLGRKLKILGNYFQMYQMHDCCVIAAELSISIIRALLRQSTSD